MSRWFRFYDDAINDPKILKLSDKLHRVWIGILCVASKNDGQLPSVDDMALMIRMKVEKLEDAIKNLVDAGLIDTDGVISSPHNWDRRQFKSDVSTERVQRFRKQARNVSVTAPETEQIQSTEAEKKDISLRSDDWPKDHGDRFWKAYPRKTEKLAAMKKLTTLRKSGIVTFFDLMAGVERYAVAVKNTEQRFVKQPTTWLNAGCWADETQPGAINGNRSHDTQRRSASADFFAGMSSVAADIDGDDSAPRAADEEIPLGRVNIEL